MYTFTYAYQNPDDLSDTQAVQHTVHNEADLAELLQALLYFVQAAGFTYVEKLGAMKTDLHTVQTI